MINILSTVNKQQSDKDFTMSEISGAVFYTDGGCKPARGIGGWGLHGYVYKNDVPKKGYGIPDWLITEKGYIKKPDNSTKTLDSDIIPEQVTVLHFVDGFGSLIPESTNNQAELRAFIEALKYIKKHSIQKATIFTDSSYTQTGVTEWLKTWRENQFRKKDGNEISNKELWETIDNLVNDELGHGVDLQVFWVEGHAGHLGNERSDFHATKGVIVGRKNINHTSIKESPPEGYWKPSINTNNFFSHRRWYFTTNVEKQLTSDGRHIYYTGVHGNDDDFLGKQMPDASFAVICLKEPEPVLELIRDYQSKIDQQNFNSVVIGKLDVIFKPSIYKEIVENGYLTLNVPTTKLDLYSPCEKQLTKELRPPRLAFNLSDVMTIMETLLHNVRSLDGYKDGSFVSGNIGVTDITDLIYEGKSPKSNKRKIKKEFTSALKSFSVKVRHKQEDNEEGTKITLSVGIDTPSRNMLSSISDDNPMIKVITWLESDRAFRYATVVETENDYGIWAGFYSNIHLLF